MIALWIVLALIVVVVPLALIVVVNRRGERRPETPPRTPAPGAPPAPPSATGRPTSPQAAAPPAAPGRGPRRRRPEVPPATFRNGWAAPGGCSHGWGRPRPLDGRGGHLGRARGGLAAGGRGGDHHPGAAGRSPARVDDASCVTVRRCSGPCAPTWSTSSTSRAAGTGPPTPRWPPTTDRSPGRRRGGGPGRPVAALRRPARDGQRLAVRRGERRGEDHHHRQGGPPAGTAAGALGAPGRGGHLPGGGRRAAGHLGRAGGRRDRPGGRGGRPQRHRLRRRRSGRPPGGTTWSWPTPPGGSTPRSTWWRS